MCHGPYGCTVALQRCTVAPPEVYRGPCMKITPLKSPITYTPDYTVCVVCVEKWSLSFFLQQAGVNTLEKVYK